MGFGRGKTRSSVYDYFKIVTDRQNNKIPKYSYKYCNWKTVQNASRMKKHLNSCKKKKLLDLKNSSASTSKSNNEMISNNNSSSSDSEDDSTNSVISLGHQGKNLNLDTQSGNKEELQPISYLLEQTIPSKTNSQTTLTSFVDKLISSEEKFKLDEKLARAIFASGTPLQIVENSYWIDFFKELRPAYKLPTRPTVSKTLLQKEYDRVQGIVRNEIDNSPYLGLTCDGWTNINHDSIVNFVVTTPSPFFYKSVETKSESHTGKYIAQEIGNVINEIGEGRIIGVVTDNAANMKLAWSVLLENHPHIAFYGCIAHGLNLLLSDIGKTQQFKNLFTNSNLIIKTFTNSHQLNGFFKERQKQIPEIITPKSLKLPSPTRWGSHSQSLESMISNKFVLKSLAVDVKAEKLISKEVKSLILNDNFWDTMSLFYKILQPVGKWITKIESDTPQLSVVCEIFKDLEKQFETFLHVDEFFDILSARRTFCLKPIHLVANSLDPFKRGQDLTENEKIEAIATMQRMVELIPSLKQNVATVLTEFANFKVKQGFWKKSFLWKVLEKENTFEKISPLTWWNAFGPEGSHLKQLAIMVLSLPATSASVERTFSTFGWIHNKKRNRLLNERAMKICYIKHNLLLRDSSKISKKKITPREEVEEGDEGNEVITIEVYHSGGENSEDSY